MGSPFQGRRICRASNSIYYAPLVHLWLLRLWRAEGRKDWWSTGEIEGGQGNKSIVEIRAHKHICRFAVSTSRGKNEEEGQSGSETEAKAAILMDEQEMGSTFAF